MTRKSRMVREEEMRAVLERWARSGLPMSRFSKREGVGYSTMCRWRRRLRVGEDLARRGGWRARAETAGIPAPSESIFVEVNPIRRRSVQERIEVVLVRVPEGADTRSVRVVLAALLEC